MDPPSKRMKFSPSNVQELELVFMRMHNVAMGYEAREVNEASSSTDIIRLANAQFPVPSHIHSSFQDKLRIQRQARFDCFQEPSLACECYKCEKHWIRVNSELDYFENVFAEKTDMELRGPGSGVERSSNAGAVFDVQSSVVGLPKSEMKLVAQNVAHFFCGLPAYEGKHPSTPVCSIAVYDVPASDHGKTAAQERWIRLQQMTPTRLVF